MRTKFFTKALALSFLFVSSCALTQSPGIKTSGIVERAEIAGEYNLVLHGNRYGDDTETVAVLDIIDDVYTFEPYAPDYDYTIRKGVESDMAVSEALQFVSSHSAFRTALIRRITVNGDTLGYEVKPLYLSHHYGQADITKVYYVLKGKRVIMYVRLKSAVDKILRRQESSE